MRRIGWGLLLGSLLAAAGCNLNPQPEPPGGTEVHGSGGAPGAGGSAGESGMGAYPGAGGKGGLATGSAPGAGGAGAFPGGNSPSQPEEPGAICSDGQKQVPCPGEADAAGGLDSNDRTGARYMASGWLVTDLTTGLVWQRGEVDASLSAAEAAAHCEAATIDGQGGFRLPSRLELLTLVDYGRSGPAIDLLSFPEAMASGYWTATVSGSSGQWSIDFAAGSAQIAAQGSTGATRCVKGSAAPPGQAPTFAGGAGAEGLSTLAWQKAPLPGAFGWAEAKAACESLTDSGGGWRLPSEKELEGLVDDSRSMPALPLGFEAPADEPTGGEFWSSTPLASDEVQAWAVDFASGVTLTGATSEARRVRCVR